MQLTIQPKIYSNTANLRRNQYNKNNFATNPVSFRGEDNNVGEGKSKKFDYDAHLQKNLESSLRRTKRGRIKDATAKTDAERIGFYEAQADYAETERLNQERIERELAERKEELNKIKTNFEEIRKELAASREGGAENTRLRQQLAEMQTEFNQKLGELRKRNEQNDNFNETYDNAVKKKEGIGWAKIAGNKDKQELLNQSFIRKISAEQTGTNVKMPNGILFYGPKSTGKTLFAKAFAEQAGCNYVEISMMMSNDDIRQALLIAGEKSKKDYDASGKAKKRTIILLDEFDSLASSKENDLGKVLEDELIAKLKNFMQNCADKYKCTLFMTTNHPLKLDSELLADQRIPVKVFLGPPEKEDAAELFKFYLQGETDQAIDYAKLAGEVMNARETNQAYSAGRIELIVQDCIESVKQLKQKVTENSLISAIQKMGPDITPDLMEKYTKEIAEMAKRR